MLLFVWMYAVSSAFFPSVEKLVTLQADLIQTQARAVETTRAVMTLGWASEDEVPHF